MTSVGSTPSSPCKTHAPDKAKKGQGSNEGVNGSANEEALEGTYSLWVVVARKRNETRNQVNGGTSMGQVHDQPWRGPGTNGSGITNNMGSVQPSHNTGPGKEVKRKLSPNRHINGPLLASSLQWLVKAPNTWAQKEVEESLESVSVEKAVG